MIKKGGEEGPYMTEKPCWEFENCGHELQCPAYPDNGTRCWEVDGTLCRNQIQGKSEEKIGNCKTFCRYYEAFLLGKV